MILWTHTPPNQIIVSKSYKDSCSSSILKTHAEWGTYQFGSLTLQKSSCIHTQVTLSLSSLLLRRIWDSNIDLSRVSLSHDRENSISLELPVKLNNVLQQQITFFPSASSWMTKERQHAPGEIPICLIQCPHNCINFVCIHLFSLSLVLYVSVGWKSKTKKN